MKKRQSSKKTKRKSHKISKTKKPKNFNKINKSTEKNDSDSDIFWEILGLFSFFVAIIILLVFRDIAKEVWRIFKLNLIGLEATLFVFLTCFIGFFLIFFIKYLIEKKIKKKRGRLLLLIFAISITIFLTGTFFIQSQFGLKESNFFLRYDKGSEVIANLKCYNPSEVYLIYNESIECEFKGLKEDLNFIAADLIFRGEKRFVGLNSYIVDEEPTRISSPEFIIPYGTETIIFKVYAINTTGGGIGSLHTTITPQVYTRKQVEDRRKNFMVYLLGLLFLVFITVPPLIIKINKAHIEEKEYLRKFNKLK